MDQNGAEKRSVMESSGQLKGRKAGKKKGFNKWLALVLCVLIAGVGSYLYWGTDLFTKEETPIENTNVAAENIRTTLIERDKKLIDRVSVTVEGGDAFTVINNIQYDADGNAIPLDTTAAPSETAEPDESATIDESAVVQNYSIEGMPYFKVQDSAVTSMMSYASKLDSQHTVEEQAKDLSIYGLDKPQMTLNFFYEDGTSETLFFGNIVPTGSYYYVAKAGDDNVYMVFGTVFNTFKKQLNALHTVEMPATITIENIDWLIVEQKDKETIELQYVESSDQMMGINLLKLKQPIQYDAHSTRSSELMEAACALTITGYAGHASTEEELAAYGLDTPRARVYLHDNQGVELNFRLGNSTASGTYARIDDTGDIYYVSADSIAFIQNARVGYLADQFTNLVNITKIESVTVEGGGERYVLSIENELGVDKDGAEKTISSYFFDGEPAEETPFKKLYQEVIGTLLDNLSADYHHQGAVVAKVTYELNTGAEPFTVEYLEYDKDYYAVRRDGLTLFLIRHEKIAKMLDSCKQFREGTFTY